ncbi:MAG TPA: DUF2087 domain-containing protein [Dehalococcoidia bacterium]|nr:DUF2087 domain-containing protein [Dehalococcoidia bacterium]
MSEVDGGGRSDYEQRVFRAFIEDGRLKSIPAKRKKREIQLRHILRSFDRERLYRESEVNMVLAAFHEDLATLCRELVEMGLLIRYRGEYARSDKSGAEASSDLPAKSEPGSEDPGPPAMNLRIN